MSNPASIRRLDAATGRARVQTLGHGADGTIDSLRRELDVHVDARAIAADPELAWTTSEVICREMEAGDDAVVISRKHTSAARQGHQFRVKATLGQPPVLGAGLEAVLDPKEEC